MTITLTHRPTPGRLIQGYGPRPKPTPTSPEIHYGEDWGWFYTDTDPVWSPAAGVVVGVGEAGAYGLRVRVLVAPGVELWFCHLSAALVEVGDEIDAGDQVGRIGSSGNTVGPHLHLELRVNGIAVDPAPYWAASAPAGTDPEPITEREPHEMKTAIVSAPNGVVVMIRGTGRPGEGTRRDFTSPADYNTRRDIVAALRKSGATDLMPMPALSAVPGVTWPQHAVVCELLGAPLK